MRKILLGSAAIAAVFCASDASAQTAAPLEQVQVTAGRLEEDLPVLLANQGTQVDTVTAADIKNGGYLDVAQSLQTTVPGLYVSPKSGPFDYVHASFQGSGTADLLWLVDGVRINNRLYASTTPIDALPASMIDRIEVIEGPEALFYGTQGIAGAINIITKDFSDTPNGAVTVGADTNDGRHLDGFFRDAIGNNHFVVYGSGDTSDGFSPFPKQDYQPSATDRDRSYNVLTIGGKYAYDFSNSLRLTLSEEHNDAKLDDLAPQLVATEYNKRNEDILSSKIDYTPSDALEVFVKGYYHWWYSHFTEFDNSLSSPGTLEDAANNAPWGFTDRGVNAMVKFEPTPVLDYYLGYDYQNYTGSDAELVISRHTESVNAVFGEVATTKAMISDVTLAAGFRYNAPSFGQDATVGNVSARWDVNNDFYVKGTVGTAFRLPTAEELFANDPDDERGNPNLKPETSQNANLTLGGQLASLPSLHWEAVGFYRDVKDMIDYETFDAITNQDVFGNVPGTVRVRGGEFALDWLASDDISADVSYTYSSATEGGGQQVSRVPQSLAKGTIDYHPASLPFGLFLSANYVGDTYDSTGGFSHVQYGDYVVFNLGGRYFIDDARHHRIDINIDNVLDKRYASQLTHGVSDTTGTSYLVPDLGLPRTAQIRYTYSF